jgi:hypothetical protein|tara:strand:+ start:3240 stop:3488 length:249 start_codon:yes stop_codon:yes gene_type:complete
MSEEKNTDDYMIDFIKAFKAVEDEMEPYKEHRRDLKKNYVENGWISKEELKFAVKAYRMMKSGDDFDQFSDIYSMISKKVGL